MHARAAALHSMRQCPSIQTQVATATALVQSRMVESNQPPTYCQLSLSPPPPASRAGRAPDSHREGEGAPLRLARFRPNGCAAATPCAATRSGLSLSVCLPIAARGQGGALNDCA
eukprot:365877-Chlamydomonas_euryale.AAC.4